MLKPMETNYMYGLHTLTREDKVNEFRTAGRKLTYEQELNTDIDSFDMILDMIGEEFEEFVDAACNYDDDPTEETRAQLCKEWADLQYVVSQAALYFEIPADAAFNRVHASNMTKVVDGNVIYREDGKILKPDTYEAPDMRGL